MLTNIARTGRTLAASMSRTSALKLSTASSNALPQEQFETLAVSVPSPFVYHVELNRPKALNTISNSMWIELQKAFDELNENKDCRVVVLSAAGRLFCAGIDLMDMSSMATDLAEEDDIARRCKFMYKKIKQCQTGLHAIEKCNKPVISAIHGACVGGGLDMVAASDIRICTEDAWFQVKEVDIGMAADVGTLQRLPKAIGSRSLVNELALTARKFPAAEAKASGFVSSVHSDKESMIQAALSLASDIAAKSPVAVQMTKRSLLFSRDHSVEEGLEHIATWNQMMLQSEDFMNAAMAAATKSPQPTFSKL